MVNPSLVVLTGPQKSEMIVNFSLLTTQVAGQPVAGSVTAFGPQVAGSSSPTVPITEVWHITDVYINGSPVGPNGQIQLLVNGFTQVVAPSIANTDLNLLTRFRLAQSVVLTPATTFAMSLVLASAPTAAATQSVYFPFFRSPYTGSGG